MEEWGTEEDCAGGGGAGPWLIYRPVRSKGEF